MRPGNISKKKIEARKVPMLNSPRQIHTQMDLFELFVVCFSCNWLFIISYCLLAPPSVTSKFL